MVTILPVSKLSHPTTDTMFLTDPTTILVVVTAAIACYFLLSTSGRPSVKLPPCPARRLPLVGNILSLDANPRAQFKAWHKQYGDYISLYFGKTLVVIVNGYNAFKETMVTHGTAFSDRPNMFISESFGMRNKGIGFACGASWKELRLTTLKILRDFGMGRDSLAEKIEEEISFYLDKILEAKGQGLDLTTLTHVSNSNCVSSILFGKRFQYEDVRFQEVVTSVSKVLECAEGSAVINYYPWLEYLPGDLFKAEKTRLHNTIIKEFVQEEISKLDTVNEIGDQDTAGPECFVSHYRDKQRKRLSAGEETALDTDNLVKTMIDLFMAGTETTSNTIHWCLVYVVNHPKIQARLHQELDAEIGHQRRPSTQDRAKLPYLEAVINESQRLGNVAPFSVMHMTNTDVTVGSENYVIPNGTQVITNMDTVLHDPDIWGADVLEFKPERFLNEDGSLRHREENIPFSIGKRSCVGESMARTELFLYLSAIFQRFELQPTEPNRPPSMVPTFGLAAKPFPFQLRCIDRFA